MWGKKRRRIHNNLQKVKFWLQSNSELYAQKTETMHDSDQHRNLSVHSSNAEEISAKKTAIEVRFTDRLPSQMSADQKRPKWMGRARKARMRRVLSPDCDYRFRTRCALLEFGSQVRNRLRFESKVTIWTRLGRHKGSPIWLGSCRLDSVDYWPCLVIHMINLMLLK